MLLTFEIIVLRIITTVYGIGKKISRKMCKLIEFAKRPKCEGNSCDIPGLVWYALSLYL